jgi:membrane fusion protein (multidrug efflux system)
VQRVPVRIALDAKELVDHPLRVGLSMEAKVDVSKTDGRMLADGSRVSAIMQTGVFDQNSTAAETEVRKIIAANGGRIAKAEFANSGRRTAPASAAVSPIAGSDPLLVAGAAAPQPVTSLK